MWIAAKTGSFRLSPACGSVVYITSLIIRYPIVYKHWCSLALPNLYPPSVLTGHVRSVPAPLVVNIAQMIPQVILVSDGVIPEPLLPETHEAGDTDRKFELSRKLNLSECKGSRAVTDRTYFNPMHVRALRSKVTIAVISSAVARCLTNSVSIIL